jgi:hypothetical protein
LEFPEGVYVNDYIEKKSYVVGGGIVTDQARVKEFMLHHGLAPVEDIAEKPVPVGRIVIIAVNVVLFAVVLVYLLVRRRRKHGAAAGLIAALILMPFSANAAELTPGGDWFVSHAEGERIIVSQCGFTVAVFALERFGRKYNLQQVSAGLRPSKDGSRGSSSFFRDVSRATRGQNKMPPATAIPCRDRFSHLPESGAAWSVRQTPSGIDSAVFVQFCSCAQWTATLYVHSSAIG